MVPDRATGARLPALFMYPSNSPETEQHLGPYTLDVAMDSDCARGKFPLIVISHGSGGSHLAYRTLAAHLARNGYVVICPEHPGNNRNDNSLAGTERNLTERPRHLQLATDFMLHDSVFAEHLLSDRVGVIGHSMGGYTALTIAGGHPSAFAHEAESGESTLLETVTDSRIKAMVLLAPASAWFIAAGALRNVHIPILMMTAERDEYTPEFHAEIVKKGLPQSTPVTHRIVPNAGHFAFVSPFPAAMASRSFPPSQDPEGFDRTAFHQQINAEILVHFRHCL